MSIDNLARRVLPQKLRCSLVDCQYRHNLLLARLVDGRCDGYY